MNRNIEVSGLSNVNESLSCHYLIYRIDNNINGKYYIGQHCTENILDGYLGSGRLIRKAEHKYGISAFTKTILFDFDNFEDMDCREAELVQLSNCFPYDKMSYNLKGGGSQGRMSEYSIEKILSSRYEHYEDFCKAISIAQKNRFANMSDEEYNAHIQQMSANGMFDMKGQANPMYGEILSDHMELSTYERWKKTIGDKSRARANDPNWLKKMSEVTSGENNPMYGKNIKDYMTPEKYEQWRKNISKATAGENNPMYGKSSWEKCSIEERNARIEKFKKHIKGKNKGRKVLINNQTGKIVSVLPEKVNEYLTDGYNFYKKHPTKLMFRPAIDVKSINVKIEDCDQFKNRGYIFGNITQLLKNKPWEKYPNICYLVNLTKNIVRIQISQKDKYIQTGYQDLLKLLNI